MCVVEPEQRRYRRRLDLLRGQRIDLHETIEVDAHAAGQGWGLRGAEQAAPGVVRSDQRDPERAERGRERHRHALEEVTLAMTPGDGEGGVVVLFDDNRAAGRGGEADQLPYAAHPFVADHLDPVGEVQERWELRKRECGAACRVGCRGHTDGGEVRPDEGMITVGGFDPDDQTTARQQPAVRPVRHGEPNPELDIGVLDAHRFIDPLTFRFGPCHRADRGPVGTMGFVARFDPLDDGRARDTSFLGSLRSELDEDSDLHQSFQTLEAAAAAARSAYLEYRLTAEGAGRLFSDLRLVSADQEEWTVGATSGLWYRRPVGTQRWFRSEAPVAVVPDTGDEPEWLIHGIGSYLLAEPEQAPAAPAAHSTLLNDDLVASMLKPSAPSEMAPTPIPVIPTLGGPKAVSGDDNDWLFEEWATPVDVAPAQVVDGPDIGLPEVLPSSLDDNAAIVDALSDEEDGPAPRADQSFHSPEDFYLPPED